MKLAKSAACGTWVPASVGTTLVAPARAGAQVRGLPTFLVLLFATATHATDYRIETLAEGLDHPWSLAFLPDGTQLVTERPGRLRVIDAHGLRAAPVAGVPTVYTGGQAGLFEVLVDRDFATNRRLYLSYAQGDDDANHLRVVRATFDGSTLRDVRPIFTATPDKRGAAHFGGRLAQLADGTIVAGVGEGFIRREDAQRLGTHFGKLVRFDADGARPADNPFPDSLVYSYGHRNPQGLVVDLSDGTLYEHEHGPRGGDELNRIAPGANYGWPLATDGVDYTGARITPFTEYPGTQAPLLHWTPSIAPAGMALYRGTMFPAWDGDLLVAALVEQSVRRIDLPSLRQEALFTEVGERLRDVRVAPDGSLRLLTDSAAGRVLRVAR
jgi:glucose/arabinose dehydrogenase